MKRVLLAAHVGLALSLSHTPLALSAETEGVESLLEEIIVTARKRSETQMEVPLSLEVIGGDDLEKQGINNFQQLSGTVPGLNYSQTFGMQNRISMRGVGATELSSVTPGVGLFVDGVFQPNQSFFAAGFHDVERIEVLRGPQGTLYGRNTLAGAINITTATPSDEFEAEVGVDVGNKDSRKIDFAVSGALTEQNLYARLSGFYDETDGFFDSDTTGESIDESESEGARLSLIYEPGEAFDARFTTSYFKQEARVPLHNDIDVTDSQYRKFIASSFSADNVDSLSVSLNLNYHLQGMDFISITSYDTNESFGDSDFALLNTIYTGAGVSFNALTDTKSIGQEFRLQSNGDKPLQWIARAGPLPLNSSSPFYKWIHAKV
ncbi:TonB-dependent receptor [Pseudomaricurvus alkylphenolicus]|uniref:TonB-dependent receptor n=1 Tax=Pseudomaricurvus alkylphenolicus TaxID=1306991 RepID=UPI00141F9F65|nr:TonB-dependent receptor [Pseudomaricurvus alkylphenolicus]NIB45062.1 TonB-dependent receptor [Pseudomaricurvus alkylphenolicus]